MENNTKTTAQLIKELKDNERMMLESIPIMSRMLYVRYGELVKSGFSKKEAFEIIRTRGLE